MRVRAVDFVGVPVQDMATSQAFYRDTLGLRPLHEAEGWAEYDAGNITVSLFVEDGQKGEPSLRNALLAFAVADVAAAVAELRANGSQVLQDTEEYPPCFMATVTDPSGNAIMLHQRKDGTAG